MSLMLRVGVKELIKGSIIGSESIVAIECLNRELFEDESSSQIVTSDKISDWVAATSTSGTMSFTSSSLMRSMAVCSWAAKTAFRLMHLHVQGLSVRQLPPKLQRVSQSCFFYVETGSFQPECCH